jgi:hypothetical protein
VAQRNDQIFQLSLTEIAFTISFILLILLGSLVFQEQSARVEAESNLTKAGNLEQLTASFAEAKTALASALSGSGAPNPDEIISRLVEVEDTRAERDRLKVVVEDLDAQLTSLTEMKTLIAKAADGAGENLAKDAVVAALATQEKLRKLLDEASNQDVESLKGNPKERERSDLERVREALVTTEEFKRSLKKELGKELLLGKESQTVEEVVKAARNYGQLTKGGINPLAIGKENADLRGQVAFLKNRLDARGGRDFPPCWADESGKVEFLFVVELQSESIAISPSWPARRESDAQMLPGISEILAGPVGHASFAERMKGILDLSKRQDPQCRHYVQLKSLIPDAVRSDRARLMVENHFYKVEVRR